MEQDDELESLLEENGYTVIRGYDALKSALGLDKKESKFSYREDCLNLRIRSWSDSGSYFGQGDGHTVHECKVKAFQKDKIGREWCDKNCPEHRAPYV